VFYSHFETIQEAIEYEKKIKWWTRKKKIDLIEKENALGNNLDSSAMPQNDDHLLNTNSRNS
jgi:predicted GIY-YIG superfamily endonuclease